jgi:hypothetical protein
MSLRNSRTKPLWSPLQFDILAVCVANRQGQSLRLLRLEHAAALLATTESLALLLHNLANLHRCIEELGCATVEADGLALVELTLAVVVRNALLLARLLETR